MEPVETLKSLISVVGMALESKEDEDEIEATTIEFVTRFSTEKQKISE